MSSDPKLLEGSIAVSQPFDLDVCLNSGQAFAWFQRENAWLGAIRQTAFALRQEKDRLFYHTSAPSFPESDALLRHYFALDDDYEKIRRRLPRDPFLRSAMRFGAGLRILRQDPWECLAGFILSSAKQIVHIRQIWQEVARRWGMPLELRGEGEGVAQPPPAVKKNTAGGGCATWLPVYSFPDPDKMAVLSEADLRSCGMGFRAPYLLHAAQQIAGGEPDLASLRNLPVEKAREKLMRLRGVGQKIADCALLFSLGKNEAFPVDTWILRVLRRVYFRNKRRVRPARLRSFAAGHFGPHGGLAQQYLFHYARMHPHFLAR